MCPRIITTTCAAGRTPTKSSSRPNNVNVNTFGKLFSQPVDGAIYAEPLYISGMNIPGKGTHNVVYVATQHGSVYAFDADSNSGTNATPLWQISVINPGAGVSSVTAADLGGCANIPHEQCIDDTPAIDLNAGHDVLRGLHP